MPAWVGPLQLAGFGSAGWSISLWPLGAGARAGPAWGTGWREGGVGSWDSSAHPGLLGASGTQPGTCPPGDNLSRGPCAPWASHAFLSDRLARSKPRDHLPSGSSVLNKLRIGLNHSNKLNKGNIFSAPAGEAVALQAGLAHQKTSIRGPSSF